MWRAALALLLFAAATSVAAVGQAAAAPPAQPRPWLWGPDASGHPLSEWERTLELLWNKSEGAAGFCVGSSRWRAERLISLSFPWPLPVALDSTDAVCSNSSLIDDHLCSPLEIEQYYKVRCFTRAVHAAKGGPACAPSLCCRHTYQPPFPPPTMVSTVHAADGEPREGPR